MWNKWFIKKNIYYSRYTQLIISIITVLKILKMVLKYTHLTAFFACFGVPTSA